MAAVEKTEITDKTKISDLTVGELQKLIHAEMQNALFEFLWDLQQYMPDPDEGLELKPEIAKRLRDFIKEKDGQYQSPEDVSRELGLDE